MSERHDDLAIVFDAIESALIVNNKGYDLAIAHEDTITANKWSIRINTLTVLLTELKDKGVDLPEGLRYER